VPWFKIDDNFWGSPKRMACTPDAIGLWTTAGSWCSQQLTDGFVPKHVLPILGGTARLAQKLVSVGLWEEVDGGWHFHDWDDYQPTKAAVEAERLAARERMRSRRVRRSSAEVRANTDRTSASVRLPRPDPSRPVPKKNSTHLDLASSRNVEIASNEQPGPQVGIDGWKPVRDLIPPEHPQAVRSGLAIEAATLLAAGTPEADVREALALWLSKPNLGPKTLPSLVSEVIRNRAGPIAGRKGPSKSDAKVAGYLALANSLADQPKEIA